jgi:hypothetical protein
MMRMRIWGGKREGLDDDDDHDAAPLRQITFPNLKPQTCKSSPKQISRLVDQHIIHSLFPPNLGLSTRREIAPGGQGQT